MTKTRDIYHRTLDLKDRLNKFLQGLTDTDRDYFDTLTQSDLIDLKMALSDINNVLTLKTTLACADWLTDFFDLPQQEKDDLIKNVNKTKPNTNGYDIVVHSKKIAVEIKCIVPIKRGEQYGAAQWGGILKDAVKLDKGIKKGKNKLDTTDYIKLIGLIDLDDKTDTAIQKLMTPAKNISTTKTNRLAMHAIVDKLQLIDNDQDQRT